MLFSILAQVTGIHRQVTELAHSQLPATYCQKVIADCHFRGSLELEDQWYTDLIYGYLSWTMVHQWRKYSSQLCPVFSGHLLGPCYILSTHLQINQALTLYNCDASKILHFKDSAVGRDKWCPQSHHCYYNDWLDCSVAESERPFQIFNCLFIDEDVLYSQNNQTQMFPPG